MENSKKSATLIIVISLVVALVFWWFSDTFSLWAMSSNPLLVMLISIILNPAYIFLILALFKEYQWRGLFSGLIISIGIDIASLSHSVARLGAMPTDPALYSYADTTIYKFLTPLIHAGPVATFILYVIIPISLLIIALMIIHRTTSFVKIFKESLK